MPTFKKNISFGTFNGMLSFFIEPFIYFNQ